MTGQRETGRATDSSTPMSITVIGTSDLERLPPPKRIATARTTNASYVDVVLPTWIAEGLQRLVSDCALQPSPRTTRRIVARDLHEEALNGLVQLMDGGGQVLFLATPIRNGVRKKLWIDGDLKLAVERLAGRADVTQGSVVLTAFHHFLEAKGASKML